MLSWGVTGFVGLAAENGALHARSSLFGLVGEDDGAGEVGEELGKGRPGRGLWLGGRCGGAARGLIGRRVGKKPG